MLSGRFVAKSGFLHVRDDRLCNTGRGQLLLPSVNDCLYWRNGFSHGICSRDSSIV